MNTKEKRILRDTMSVSAIEKKWNVPTNRALKLFCRAFGVKKPNTDKPDAWSRQMLKKKNRRSESCDSGSCPGCSSNCKGA